ncbi:MAG TPA: proprotein convertase P-domain-containing protein, partial [Kofleriaceae bacterium]
TAMMEIVHDMAPDANLVFASAFISPEAFADNIRQLRFTYHCDVIVDDVIYYFESPYEDDIIAQAVNDMTADGALYFSSAGNAGNWNDGTSGVWEGDFKSAGALSTLPSGYSVHDFGNKTISNRVEVAGGPLYLHWSDPGSLDNPAAENDYDVFVLDGDLRNVLAAGTDIQDPTDGSDLAFEFLGVNVPAGSRVVIAKKGTAAVRAVRLVVGGGEFGIGTTGATYGHNSAKNGFGVAAVDVAESAGAPFTSGPTTPVETYSSDGPRRIFYYPDNAPINYKYTFADNGGEVRNKPDLAAADGVTTTLPGDSGLNPFFGTSAAAPHAGAIAALIKSAVPSATAAKIRYAMTAGTLDIAALGFDQDSGSGIVDALLALAKAKAPPAVNLELATATITPTTGQYILPGSSVTIATSLLDSGGAKATAVTATLATTTPGVTITTDTVTFGDIAAGATVAAANAFAFTVSPTELCGTKISFTMTVNYTGLGTHPVVFSFSTVVGHASATTTVSSYTGARIAIPDGNVAGIDIPITLAGVGLVSNVNFHIQGTTCSATTGSTTVGLDHSWVGDVTLTLKSPAGTTVTLMSRPGGQNNSGNNFCQTVLTDSAATSIQTIAIANAPWTGSFQPASPLAAFAGENANGTWILHASDAVSVDTGGVRAFSLDTTGFVCTP